MSTVSLSKIIDKVFDGFKKITPALVAIAIISGFILFLPKLILGKLGLENLSPKIITIIGFVFLLSCALIITILSSMFFGRIKKWIHHKNLLKNLKKQYLKLSPAQKKIIKNLMRSNFKSIKLNALSGDTIYLLEKGFIYKPEQIVEAIDAYENTYTYVPQPWLLDLFEKESQLFNN